MTLCLSIWSQVLQPRRQSHTAVGRQSSFSPAFLKPYWRGILARMRWPMHTGRLKGINNRIKVMKRVVCGYRDSDFFFLKIKATFPGNP